MAFSQADILEEFVEASRRSSVRVAWDELPSLEGHPLPLRPPRERRFSPSEVQARYRERHRERIRARQAAWVEANLEKARAQALASYHRHRDEVLARSRARTSCKYCKAPRAGTSTRCAKHKEWDAEYSRRRSARLRAA